MQGFDTAPHILLLQEAVGVPWKVVWQVPVTVEPVPDLGKLALPIEAASQAE